MLPDTLAVKMTVKICEAAARALRIRSLEGSLMIEWNEVQHLSVSIAIY